MGNSALGEWAAIRAKTFFFAGVQSVIITMVNNEYL